MVLYKLYSFLNKESTIWWWPNQERPKYVVEQKPIPELIVFDLPLLVTDIQYTTGMAHLKIFKTLNTGNRYMLENTSPE